MRTRSAALVALLGAAGLVVSLVVTLPRLDPGPASVRGPQPGPVSSPTGPGAVSPGKPPAPVSGGSPVGRSDASVGRPPASADVLPVRMSLGSVDLDLPVRPVGVTPDGQMQLPPDPSVLGWYRFGSSPRSDGGGSVVLAGHLDSRRFGLGPLVRLRAVSVGDDVVVRLSDGSRSTYRVRDVERFDRQALPAGLFSRSGPELLRIVTCGGEYDPEAGGYQQNLVVTAAPG